MELTIYLFVHKSGLGAINGDHRGVMWQNGVAVLNDKLSARRLRRRMGGTIHEATIEVEGEPGSSDITVCSCPDKLPVTPEEVDAALDEEPAEEELSYQDKLAVLREAKDEGVFDWYDYTGGSMKKADVNAAYEALQGQG